MSVENEIENTTTEVSQVDNEVSDQKLQRVDQRLSPEPKTEKSIRHLLKSGMEKAKTEEDKPLPMTGKERRQEQEQQAAKDPVEAENKTSLSANDEDLSSSEKDLKSDKSVEAAPPPTPQVSAIAPPAALTKEEKALWASVPEKMQEAFLRRESDTQKGIDNLKAKYQPIEDVLLPIRPLLQQNGLTEANAVRQLFDWHRALASPNKVSQISAFRALAQSHGVDINMLVPQQNFAPQNPANPQQTQPQAQTTQQQDPLAQFQPLLEQYLQPLHQRQASYEAEIQRQRMDQANAELATFARDKPHFEKVRVPMAEILTIASQFGRPVTLQQAYDQAIWGMPEIRDEMLQQQETEREAKIQAQQEVQARQQQEELAAKQKKEADELANKRRLEQEALEKARRASVSPRSSTPTGVIAGGKPRSQTVADTIRAALRENRAGV